MLSVSPASPAAVPDYTVSARYSAARSYHAVHLVETDPWGTVNELYVGSTSFDRAFANRVNGAYAYRLRGCYAIPAPGTGGEVCEFLGDRLSVKVEAASPDSMATQLSHAYEARISPAGDALRIQRTSAAKGGGQFTAVVLRTESPSGAGGVALEAPEQSPSQAALPPWTVTAAVDLVLSDVNLDGFADVLVRGLDNAGTKFSKADDQILYAPGRAGGAPSNRRAVDDSLKDFLTEVGEWTGNPDYFENRFTTRPVYGYRWNRVCWVDDRFISENLERYCGWTRQRVVVGKETVYTNSSTAARQFARRFSWVDGRIDPGVTPGSTAATAIDRILSDILGAGVLNDQLGSACAGSLAYDADTDIACNNPRKMGLILLHHGTRVAQAIDGYDPKTEPAATPVGRQRDLTKGEKELAADQGLDSIDLSEVVIEHAPKSLVDEDMHKLKLETNIYRAWYVFPNSLLSSIAESQELAVLQGFV